MAEPRRVDFSLADRRSMTMVEVARACALADVGPREADELMRGLIAGEASGDDFLRAVTLATALALQIVRRAEPELTLDDALSWDLHMVEGEPDRLADVTAELAVDAAVISGLPPREAVNLSERELERYSELRERAAEGR